MRMTEPKKKKKSAKTIDRDSERDYLGVRVREDTGQASG